MTDLAIKGQVGGSSWLMNGVRGQRMVPLSPRHLLVMKGLGGGPLLGPSAELVPLHCLPILPLFLLPYIFPSLSSPLLCPFASCYLGYPEVSEPTQVCQEASSGFPDDLW